MGVREKAKGIVEKFETLLLKKEYKTNGFFTREIAKESALIAVDEIISAVKNTTGHCELRLLDRQGVEMDIEFWQEVRNEINKL